MLPESIEKLGTVQGNQVGTAIITVFDSRNVLNNDTILVHVTPISYMNWLEEKMEIHE